MIEVDPKVRRDAAEILRAEIKKLKKQARKADSLTAPILWLKVRDLEKIAQWIEDDD